MTDIAASRPYLRIATEEAWAPPEVIALYRRHLAEGTIDDIGFSSLMGYFLGSTHPQPQSVVARLQDAAVGRIEAGAASAALPAMSSYERKLVHDLVAERGYHSESEGEGRDRHTVIRAGAR